MNSGINKFKGILAKMDGPPQLRSSLRRSTRPIASVLSSVDGVEAVKARMPAAIIGGAVLTLLSSRLRRLLEERDQSGAVVSQASYKNRASASLAEGSAAGRGHQPLTAGHAIGRRKLDNNPRPSDSRGRSWEHVGGDHNAAILSQPLLRAAHGESETVFDLPRGMGTTGEAVHAFPSLLNEAGSLSDFSAGVPGRNKRLSFSGVSQRAARKSETQRHASLFVSELKEYWELSLSKEAITHNSDQAHSARSSEPAAALHRQHSENGPAAQRRWPELIGGDVARKARAAASDHRHDQSNAQVRQTMRTDSADKVEIQNVFNIEVKADGNGTASIEDLAEKITDILHEQALQHGIDVT